MTEYHKINSIFKRDPETKYKTFLWGDFSEPEFEYLADNPWEFTEKVDGTNLRVGINEVNYGDHVVIRGRTDAAHLACDLLENVAALFAPRIKEYHEHFPNGVVFYGEGYGPGIQKGGGLYRPDKSFVLFDIKLGDHWVCREDVAGIASHFGLDIVPIIGTGTLWDALDICKSHALTSRWGSFEAEGIVARPRCELLGRFGQRIITKVKCKDFPQENNNVSTMQRQTSSVS